MARGKKSKAPSRFVTVRGRIGKASDPTPLVKAIYGLEKNLRSAQNGSKAALRRLPAMVDDVVRQHRAHHEGRPQRPSAESLTTEDLLRELASRAGPEAALGEAGLVAHLKTKDYDDGLSRDRYFPLGLPSFAQMIHVKSERLLSFARRERGENFEGVRDSALDLINYASFLADWLGRRPKASVQVGDGS